MSRPNRTTPALALLCAVCLLPLLLPTTAQAVNWVTWHCPVPGCDSIGEASYFCYDCQAGFTRPAMVDADGVEYGPPQERCPTCGQPLTARWACCHHDWPNAHKFYPPDWKCSWGGQWYFYNYY